MPLLDGRASESHAGKGGERWTYEQFEDAEGALQKAAEDGESLEVPRVDGLAVEIGEEQDDAERRQSGAQPLPAETSAGLRQSSEGSRPTSTTLKH